MKNVEWQDVVVPQQVEVGRTCDGCGVSGDVEDLAVVVIAVNEGEEGGGRDELDLCDPCLVGRAPALVAAGSTAVLVTGLPRDPD